MGSLGSSPLLDVWRALGSTLLALAASCSFGPELSRHARAVRPTPEAAAHFRSAKESLTRGDVKGAEVHLREAVAADPDFVRARRALQDLQVSTFRRSQAYEEAEAELRRAPHSARAHYLMSRVREGTARRRHLERALELDPYDGWARLGLANDREEREGRGSGFELAEEAAILLPNEPDAALARIRSAWGRVPDFQLDTLILGAAPWMKESPPIAEAAVRRLLTRSSDPVQHVLLSAVERSLPEALLSDSFCQALTELLERGVTVRLRDSIESGLAALRKAGPYQVDLEIAHARLRASSLLTSGRAAEARIELERAYSLGERDPKFLRCLRRARVADRRYLDAIALESELLDQFGETLGAPLTAAEECLLRAGGRASEAPGDPAAIQAFAQCAVSAGWLDEGSELLAQAILGGNTSFENRELLRQVDAARRFLSTMPGLLSENPTPAPGLLTSLRGLRRIGFEVLGFDPFEGSQVQNYLPVGILLQSDPSAPGFPRFLDRYGFEIRLGKRWFGPVEAFALRRIASREIEGTILGRPYRGREVLGEGLPIFTRLERNGSHFAGTTLPGSVFLVLDPIASQAEEVDRLRELQQTSPVDWKHPVLPPCATEAERWAADETWDLASRLTLAALERDPSPAAPRLLELVRLHEYGHLADAEAFLPLATSVHHVLAWLVSAGFSITAIEARLELRAELTALCATRDPELALAEIVRAAPRPASQVPHSLAFAELTRRFLREVAKRREQGLYPGLDRAYPILPQLWKLEAEEIRSVALELARDEGILAP